MANKKRTKNVLRSLSRIFKYPVIFSIIILITLVVLVLFNPNQFVILGSVLFILVIYFFFIMYFSNEMSLIEISFTTFAFTLISSPLIIYAITLFIKSNDGLIKSGSVDAWITFAGSIIGGSLVMLSLSISLLNENLAKKELLMEKERKELISILPIIDISPIFICTDDYPPNQDPYEFSLTSENYSRTVKPVIKITNISSNSLTDLKINSAQLFFEDSEFNYKIQYKQLDNFNSILLPDKSVYYYLNFEDFINQYLLTKDYNDLIIDINLRVDFSYNNIMRSNQNVYSTYFLANYYLDIRNYQSTLSRKFSYRINKFNIIFNDLNLDKGE